MWNWKEKEKDCSHSGIGNLGRSHGRGTVWTGPLKMRRPLTRGKWDAWDEGTAWVKSG